MSLSTIFKVSAGAALAVGGFVLTGYIGSGIFDGFFWDVFHNSSNLMGQAIKLAMAENFGFIHEWTGLTGSGGLLNNDWIQDIIGLKPYLARVTPAPLMPDAASITNFLDL